MRLPFGWWLPLGSVSEISADELRGWLQAGRPLQLVDARTLPEYQSGTLPGAQFAPLTGMPDSLNNLKFDPDLPVVALCLSGHRSRPAVRWLRARGIQAYSLQGGLTAWKKHGYPLSKPGR